jgi:hypothetical protein
MKLFNDYIFLGIISVIICFIIVLLIWLISDRFKLKKELRVLSDYISRNNRDVAGLCSAALKVDERLIEHEELLNDLQTKMTEQKKAEPSSQSYHGAIQRVQAGGTVADLMQNFGLSRDEATLLIHLHGAKNY